MFAVLTSLGGRKKEEANDGEEMGRRRGERDLHLRSAEQLHSLEEEDGQNDDGDATDAFLSTIHQ